MSSRSITSEMLNQHTRLVHKIAKKLFVKVKDSAIDYEDLYAEGLIGLMKALETYDPESGNAFSSFAYPTISGTINNFLDRKSMSVRFPTHCVRLAILISKDGLIDASPQEVANRYSVTLNKATTAIEYIRSRTQLSLDMPRNEDDDRNYEHLAKVEDDLSGSIVEEFLQKLKPQYRELLELLMQGYERKEIAKRHGVSRQAIAQRLESIKLEYEKYKRKAESSMVVHKMSPEELEDYRARTGNKVEPDKTAFLKSIAEGNSIAATEKAMGLRPNTIYHWLKKWGLTGIKQDRARELLQKPAPVEKIDGDLKDAEIQRLNEQMKDYQLQAINGWSEVERLEEELKRLNKASAEKDQLIAELSNERGLLLETIEKAVTPAAAGQTDPVNHPAHYTAGAVECIDAIESATTGLTGGQAYATGAAIKYLWRWSRKNGVEDLQKARWYIDRLIGEETGR